MLGIEWKKKLIPLLSRRRRRKGQKIHSPLFLLIKTGRREVYRINGGKEKGKSNLYCSLRDERRKTGCGL